MEGERTNLVISPRKKTIGKDSCDGSSKASIKEARGDETQIKAIVCESSDFFLRRSVGP